MSPLAFPATATWFAGAFPAPTRVQQLGWPVIARGAHTLLLAPTGSGKTLAAFLVGIDRVARLPTDAPPGVRVLYVSPLKALVYDVERNLRGPLVGIQRTAERLNLPSRPIGVDVRTGDTPQRERQRQKRAPAEILVTTPESLFLLLGSSARDTLATVDTIIVDEIHVCAASKRGVHLAVSLERLCELTDKEPQRVGLSATVRPVDEVARFLGGDRAVEVVDAAEPPRLQLQVVVTVPDMAAPPQAIEAESPSLLRELAVPKKEAPSERRLGLWPSISPELLKQIEAHRSTILFTNSRGLCERLANKLWGWCAIGTQRRRRRGSLCGAGNRSEASPADSRGSFLLSGAIPGQLADLPKARVERAHDVLSSPRGALAAAHGCRRDP